MAKNLRVNPNYSDAHSKRYQSSVISPFLVERDDKGNVLRYNNDIKLLLRQKDLHKSIGYDAIRAYVDKLNTNPIPTHNLTDEELMGLIPPDGVDTITDLYQYNKYLEAHQKEIKSRYDALQKHKREAKEREDRFNSFFKNNKTNEGN